MFSSIQNGGGCNIQVVKSHDNQSVSIVAPQNMLEFIQSHKRLSLAVDTLGTDLLACGIVKIIYHTLVMAPCRNNIRCSETIWVSRTGARRRASVEKLFELFPHTRRSSMALDRSTYCLEFNGIKCKVMFRIYKNMVQISDLPNASFYVFDEFQKVKDNLLRLGLTRAGSYPSRRESDVGCVTDKRIYNGMVWGISNRTPSARSFWGKYIKDNSNDIHLLKLP